MTVIAPAEKPIMPILPGAIPYRDRDGRNDRYEDDRGRDHDGRRDRDDD